jgi:hypothetical protein
MRNDSRPLGEHSPGSPVGGDDPMEEQRPIESERPDPRDTIAHGRASHIVHRESEKDQPNDPRDPVTPFSDASQKTRI